MSKFIEINFLGRIFKKEVKESGLQRFEVPGGGFLECKNQAEFSRLLKQAKKAQRKCVNPNCVNLARLFSAWCSGDCEQVTGGAL